MQQPHYYIDIEGIKDGPLDLITVMRRIRAQKILPQTGIYVDDSDTAIPAYQLEDIAMFFAQAAKPAADLKKTPLTLRTLLRDGWRFTMEHNGMTVFAGGFICLIALFGMSLIKALNPFQGAIATWVIFMICYHIYLIFSLRLYRGQPLSSNFVKQSLAPVLIKLVISAIIMALMMLGGAILLLVPALALAMYYVFVPFFIFDRRMGVIEAMMASRLLARKHNGCYQATIMLLLLAFVLSVFLIIPLPLVMPVVSAALIRIYEDLSAA